MYVIERDLDHWNSTFGGAVEDVVSKIQRAIITERDASEATMLTGWFNPPVLPVENGIYDAATHDALWHYVCWLSGLPERRPAGCACVDRARFNEQGPATIMTCLIEAGLLGLGERSELQEAFERYRTGRVVSISSGRSTTPASMISVIGTAAKSAATIQRTPAEAEREPARLPIGTEETDDPAPDPDDLSPQPCIPQPDGTYLCPDGTRLPADDTFKTDEEKAWYQKWQTWALVGGGLVVLGVVAWTLKG